MEKYKSSKADLSRMNITLAEEGLKQHKSCLSTDTHNRCSKLVLPNCRARNLRFQTCAYSQAVLSRLSHSSKFLEIIIYWTLSPR